MTRSDMHTRIVDRIENGIAVLEGDDGSLDLPASWLPVGAGEGSVLRVEVEREGDSSRLVLTLDPQARSAREAEIREIRASIPEAPGGDITL